jgi:CO/xanthine dehydrogenase FAD-binding subunit
MSCRMTPELYSMKPFEYSSPKTLKETLSLIEKFGAQGILIAGGTDLIPLLKLRFMTPRYVVDISKLSELDFIKSDGKLLRIGALTKHRTLERSTVVMQSAPILAEAASLIGSPLIRNMGTVGGNLVNASPCSDTSTPLLALGAQLQLVKSSGQRIVAIDDFFLDVKKTVIQHDELLTEVQIPDRPPGTGAAFVKVGRRMGNDLSVVSVAASINMQKGVCKAARIALGSVAPTPVRVRKAESSLVGKTLGAKEINEAAEISSQEIRPISDVRASAEYRREVSKEIVQMAINKAIEKTGV